MPNRNEKSVNDELADNFTRVLAGRSPEAYHKQTEVRYVSGPKKGEKVSPRKLRDLLSSTNSPSLDVIAAIAAAEQLAPYQLLLSGLGKNDDPAPDNLDDTEKNPFKAWRLAAGLTLQQLADELGKDRAYTGNLSRLENDKLGYSDELLSDLAKVYGTTKAGVLAGPQKTLHAHEGATHAEANTFAPSDQVARLKQLIGNDSFATAAEKIKAATGFRVSAQAIHKWLNGGRMRPETRNAVSATYGKPPQWLEFGNGTAPMRGEPMKTTSEFRRAWIQKIIVQYGRREVESRLGCSTTYIGMIDGTGAQSRNIGNKKAREIEQAFDLPHGVMDSPPGPLAPPEPLPAEGDSLNTLDNTVDAASFAARVKQLRIAAGLNQPQLAAMVGLTKASIHFIENGNTQEVKMLVLFKLAAALGVGAHFLATGNDSPLDPPTPAHAVDLTAGRADELEGMEKPLILMFRALPMKDKSDLFGAVSEKYSAHMSGRNGD